jgi:hypothetical protein
MGFRNCPIEAIACPADLLDWAAALVGDLNGPDGPLFHIDGMIQAWSDARACARMFLPPDVWASLPGPIEWPEVVANYEAGQAWVLTDLRSRLLDLRSKFLGETDRQTDTPADKGKKSSRNKRGMTKEAWACVELYRLKRKEDAELSMKEVVEEYAENTGCSYSATYRVLNDNSDQWKNR